MALQIEPHFLYSHFLSWKWAYFSFANELHEGHSHRHIEIDTHQVMHYRSVYRWDNYSINQLTIKWVPSLHRAFCYITWQTQFLGHIPTNSEPKRDEHTLKKQTILPHNIIPKDSYIELLTKNIYFYQMRHYRYLQWFSLK